MYLAGILNASSRSSTLSLFLTDRFFLTLQSSFSLSFTSMKTGALSFNQFGFISYVSSIFMFFKILSGDFVLFICGCLSSSSFDNNEMTACSPFSATWIVSESQNGTNQ